MDQPRHQLNPTLSHEEDNPEVLCRNIQHTRAEIGETVNEIQERLSPDRIKKHMKTAAREKMESVKDEVQFKAEQWQSNIIERIRNNPIPASMVGVGLAWMWKQICDARREQDRRFRTHYSLDPHEEWPDYAPHEKSGLVSHESPAQGRTDGTMEMMKAKVKHSGRQARDQFSTWTSQAQDSFEEWKFRASEQKGQMREQGDRAKGEFRRYLQDNPLTIGAVTVAIGAAIGLSLPRTVKEDQWLGETRDKFMDQAKTTAKEILPKTKEIADEMTQAAREAVKEQMGGHVM